MASEVRKYFVKGSWVFNLESMDDKLHCILIDVEDGVADFPIEVAGTTCKDESDVYDLIDECQTLQWAAKSRRVTGKEYGRIKQIVEWRVGARYVACMNSGMAERDAGLCFQDI